MSEENKIEEREEEGIRCPECQFEHGHSQACSHYEFIFPDDPLGVCQRCGAEDELVETPMYPDGLCADCLND